MSDSKNGGRATLAVLAVTALVATAGACSTETASPEGAEEASFDRPIDMVAPFGPGGGSDQVARAVSKAMEGPIGTDIPVVNVPGATGSTGTTKMLSSTPGDAMSILIQDTLTTVAAGSASFELEEIRAVCRMQSMPSALLVRKGTYSDWEDLKQAATSTSEPLKVGTVGSDSVDDIVLAALTEEHGTKFRAVPFSEPTERYAALLGGEVDVIYEQLGDVRQYLDSGDFVPVILLADEPVEGYEDVPAATDIGLPEEVVLPQFRGIVVNADTPDDVVSAIADACEKAIEDPEVQEFQKEVFAVDDSFQDAEEYQSFLEEQYDLISTQLEQYGMVQQ